MNKTQFRIDKRLLNSILKEIELNMNKIQIRQGWQRLRSISKELSLMLEMLLIELECLQIIKLLLIKTEHHKVFRAKLTEMEMT